MIIIIKNRQLNSSFATSLSISWYLCVGQWGRKFVSSTLQLARHPFRLKSLQAEHEKLEKEIAELEKSNTSLGDRRGQLSQEQQQLEAQIQQLSAENRTLSIEVQRLTTHNDELVDANKQLKKDNKDLKNIVDQIRLRLARDTKMLLEYEDSEIRKALIRLFRWTLG